MFEDLEDSVSPVIGVVILIGITLVLAAGAAALFFGFGDISSTSTAGVSLDEGRIKVDTMGTADKIIIKSDDGNVELDSAGETQRVYGGESVVAVSEDGSETVLRTVTDQEIIDSGGDPFKDPSSITKDDFKLISSVPYSSYSYPSGKNRIAGTKEIWKVKFTDDYDSQDFSYNWDFKREFTEWNSKVSINENGEQATLKYEYNTDSNGIKVTLSSGGTSKSKSSSSYSLERPFVSADVDSLESGYVGSEKRIAGTDEKWEIKSISPNSNLKNVLGEDISLSDYSINWDKTSKFSQWNSDVSITENGLKATYSYDGIAGGDSNSPAVKVSLPEVSTTNKFKSINKYEIKKPIASITLESQNETYSPGEDREAYSKENWSVTSVTPNSGVSDVANVPDTVSGYNYNWGYSDPFSQWSSGFSISSTDNESVYEYGNAPDSNSPKVSVSIPGVDYSVSTSAPKYNIVD